VCTDLKMSYVWTVIVPKNRFLYLLIRSLYSAFEKREFKLSNLKLFLLLCFKLSNLQVVYLIVLRLLMFIDPSGCDCCFGIC
jgi:hypothetical protein